ncbi:MAG: divergent polysaccharide deacetylase family protein [Pseudomonadota bacterium]|nr:divergent polysaccharide deacetylase family protein [Pseudomonadota bacterium]
MAPDDLNTPLGQKKAAKKSALLPVSVAQAIAAGLGLFVVVFILWAAIADNPLGGEPMVVVSAEPPALPQVQKPEAAPLPYDGPTASTSAKPSALTKTITIIDGSSGKTQEIVIPGAADAKPAAGVNSRLAENSRHGPIPIIASDGARPSDVYARPLKSGQPSAPRVALIIGGLGVASGGTAEALAKMPGPVTLAFAPDGSDLENPVARARDAGHEMLLQVPMESPDYSETDPGAHTLLTSLPAEQNIDRLHWLMSRFQGYVGIGNFIGGRFSASESALAPVLRETAKRGLIYVDDGSSPRSIASQVAANTLPYAKVEILIDASPKADDIDKALSRLEALARERGTAVGMGQALPVTLDRVAKWAKAAAARGIVLVPISAVAGKAKSG